MSFTMMMTSVDPNAHKIVREFETRQEAQRVVDDLYVARKISRDEWGRLFNILSALDTKGHVYVCDEPTKALQNCAQHVQIQ